MAYAAVTSLKHSLEQLMADSCDVLQVPPSTQIIESAYNEVKSLQAQLKELDSWSTKRCSEAFDERLGEQVCRFEDLIDTHITNQLLSQAKSLQLGHAVSFSADLQDLEPEIRIFTAELKKMKSAYLEEISNGHDDDDDDVQSRLIDSGENKPKIVDLYSDQIFSIKEKFLFPRYEDETEVFSLVGMAGIGKTTLAKQIFEDPDIVESFEYFVWVSFGRKKYTYLEIAGQILDQLDYNIDKWVTQGYEDEEIRRELLYCLEGKRCFIVFDDVWDEKLISQMKLNYNFLFGSRLLLTTRRREVADEAKFDSDMIMQLLNKEDSWLLFCAKVFGEEPCPPVLVKPGKKIVEKCEGLPLLIVTVANLLSKTEDNRLEYWSKVAEDKRNKLLKDACREIHEVLFPSYDHLPQHLKTCFLYMGVFPQDCEIPKSYVIKLWTAERFLEIEEVNDTPESCSMRCLDTLFENNVLLVYQRTSNCPWLRFAELKTCGLHCSFWHMCNKIAEKNKFLHVLNNVEDGLEAGIKGHRRLCIHNNVLFGIKDVHSSIERVCAFTARSLLCFGPYHKYEIPMCFGLRVLKVLHALPIRFYDFPLEALKLVVLRYLALTCNGKIPPSTTELRRLEFLIVGRHLRIKSSRAPSYLPMEIWDMKELQHVQIMGCDLPDPCGNILPKLFTLKGVSAHSCTKEVFQGICKNLMRLGILIELDPNATESICCFDHISILNVLYSLKYVVVNPMFLTPPATTPFSVFPPWLWKLHLSGMGYPWEYMTPIASMPKLKELKLRCYAFQGPKWEIEDRHFPNLKYLLVEDTDLVQLKAGWGSFDIVQHITMKHCYRLQELHLDGCRLLEQIDLVDCNPLSVKYVEQLIEDRLIHIPRSRLVVHCSWKDGNHKSSQLTNLEKSKFLKPL